MGNTKCACIARDEGAAPKEDEQALLTSKLSELEDEIRKLRDERARITQQCKVVRMEAVRAASNGGPFKFSGASPRTKHIAAVDSSPRSVDIDIEEVTSPNSDCQESAPRLGPIVTHASRSRAVSAPLAPSSAGRTLASRPRSFTLPSHPQSEESLESKVAVRQMLNSAFAFAAVTLMSDEDALRLHAAVMDLDRKEACLLAKFSLYSLYTFAAVANLSAEELADLAGEVLQPHEESPMPRMPEKEPTPSERHSASQESTALPSDSDKEGATAGAPAASTQVAALPTPRRSVRFDSDWIKKSDANPASPAAAPAANKAVQRRATVCVVSAPSSSAASSNSDDDDEGDDGDELDGKENPILRARTSVLALRQSALELRAELAARAASAPTPPATLGRSTSSAAPTRKQPDLKRRQSAPALLINKAPMVSSHVSAAEIGRKLVDILFEFPQAATKGVRWEVLARLYSERHGFSLELFSPTVRTALLFDGLRKLKTGDALSPVLGLEDEVLMAQSWIRHNPGHRLGCWPSLYAALCRVLEEEFRIGPGSAGTSERVHGSLPELESLLRSGWHAGFDVRSLSFRDLHGRESSIADMGELVEAMLRWRTERVESQQEGNDRFSAVDEAILPRLELEGQELTLRRPLHGGRLSLQGARASVTEVEQELWALRARNAELQMGAASA